jgi:hypothetical protein
VSRCATISPAGKPPDLLHSPDSWTWSGDLEMLQKCTVSKEIYLRYKKTIFEKFWRTDSSQKHGNIHIRYSCRLIMGCTFFHMVQCFTGFPAQKTYTERDSCLKD